MATIESRGYVGEPLRGLHGRGVFRRVRDSGMLRRDAVRYIAYGSESRGYGEQTTSAAARHVEQYAAMISSP